MTINQLNWTAEEQAVITQLGKELDLSDAQVLRCALRAYQADHQRRKAGETVSWSGDAQRAADFAGPLAARDQYGNSAEGAFEAACLGISAPDALVDEVTIAILKRWNELKACGPKDLALAAIAALGGREAMKIEPHAKG